MRNEDLLKIEATSECFFWINDQAGFNEDGLYYTTWHSYGSTSVLRDALDPADEQSVPWLRLQMNNIIESLEKLNETS